MQTYALSDDGIGALTIQFFNLETLEPTPSLTIDVSAVYPLIQASALAYAARSADGEVPVAGFISASQPANIVLTDWIP